MTEEELTMPAWLCLRWRETGEWTVTMQRCKSELQTPPGRFGGRRKRYVIYDRYVPYEVRHSPFIEKAVVVSVRTLKEAEQWLMENYN